MRACAIPGCTLEGVNSLGVRCRRPSSRALWAPNADVGLCHAHARYGLTVRLELELELDSPGVTVKCSGSSRFVPFSEAVAQ